MTKDRIVAFFLMLLSLILFLGTSEMRIQKAQWLGNYIFPPFIRSIENFQNSKRLFAENRKLSEKVAQQTLENLALRNRIKTLQNTLQVPAPIAGSPFVVAEVIGYSGNYWERNLILNKGTRNHIQQNDPVISADGVVGKIIITTRNYSVVLPLSNSQFRMPVMDKTSSVQGVLETDYYGHVYMGMIKLGSQVNIGDTLVTSNISQIFPKGYPIGKIIKLKESQDNMFLKAEVQPFAMTENVESVFIINQSKEATYEREFSARNQDR